MIHNLYDVWESMDDMMRPWAVQMINYVAHFRNEGEAHQYVEIVKKERKRLGLK